jgi:hypothetical protein
MKKLFKAGREFLKQMMNRKIDYQKIKELSEQNTLKAYEYWVAPRL